MACLGNLRPHLCGPHVIRRKWLAAGEEVKSHKHNFDHTTQFLHGRARVYREFPNGNKDDVLLENGEYCEVLAGVMHRIVAETDGLNLCWYPHRLPSGEVVEHYTGWTPGYE